MDDPFKSSHGNTYQPSSPWIEQMIEDALTPILNSTGTARADPDVDGSRLGNIRLLAHVRGGKTGEKLRQRFIDSMENLFGQMPNAALKQQAKIIIMTAKRT